VPRRRSRAALRFGQASPGKGRDLRGTTPDSTCVADTGTSFCRANSSAPPASQPVSVRGLAAL